MHVRTCTWCAIYIHCIPTLCIVSSTAVTIVPSCFGGYTYNVHTHVSLRCLLSAVASSGSDVYAALFACTCDLEYLIK